MLKKIVRFLLVSAVNIVPSKYLVMVLGARFAGMLLEEAAFANLLRDVSDDKYHIKEELLPTIYAKNNVSISGATEILFQGNLKLKDNNVVLIAHWDPDFIVDDYVLYYAEAFKKRGATVFLCSANNVEINDKIRQVIDCVLWRKCAGYDFTSWKSAFELFPELFEASQITISNDSVFCSDSFIRYGLFFYVRKCFCSFWGLTFSDE